MIQVVSRWNHGVMADLSGALKDIGEKTKATAKRRSAPTAKAAAAQKKYHSSISILKKMRQMRNIKHVG